MDADLRSRLKAVFQPDASAPEQARERWEPPTPMAGGPRAEAADPTQHIETDETLPRVISVRTPLQLDLHACGVCDAFGAFGFGFDYRRPEETRWFCREHRPIHDGGALPIQNPSPTTESA